MPAVNSAGDRRGSTRIDAMADRPGDEVLCESLASLVAIPSVNPLHAGPRSGEPGERALAEAVAERLRRMGAEVVLDEVESGRPNVYGIFDTGSERWASLDVHTDTVSVEHMTGDPFDGRIDGGKVHGRGSVDTKASLGVMLALLEHWQATGVELAANFVLAGTISEEGGGLLGGAAYAEWLAARSLVLDELIVAEPTSCVPIYGHKGGVGFQVEVLGRAAHTSKPELGANAIEGAAHVVLALADEHRRLAETEPVTEVGVGTLTTTIVTGGTARNVVPDRCVIDAGRRIVPYEDPDQVFAHLSELVTRACPLPVEITRITEGHRAFYQSPDAPWLRQLGDWVGAAPDTAPYGTNALRYGPEVARSIAVLGPGSIDQAHAAEEWVEITELARVADLYTHWLT